MIVSSFICSSQTTDSLIIRKDSSCYYVENTGEIYSILYEIDNRSSNIFYLWIEKDIHSSEDEIIKDYFIKNKGDMNLYQMAMETNIIYGCPSLFNTFLKKINPREIFTIQIISTKIISDCKKEQIFKYLDNHTVIISENILEQYIKGLPNFNSLIFYQKDFITVPLDIIGF